jgi:murein DD-endopeptidase MepM/ murein hydrolase activator NlpD
MQKTITDLLFPLPIKPKESYKSGARRFGANRDHGRRKHAGIDLYAPVGTAVRAMADGVVIRAYDFYGGTQAIEVDHGDFIARYGEVSVDSILVEDGDQIARGEKLAEVGKLKGLVTSMLHLEMFGTTDDPTARGKGLTQRANLPFQRRLDLIDPTESIDKSVME